MFKIASVKINNFWHRFDANTEFNDNVNIIIGKNGTGKTTFMSILQAALTVNQQELYELDFESVTIYLHKGKQKRTIKVTKKVKSQDLFGVEIDYQISKKIFPLKAFGTNSPRNMHPFARRRLIEEYARVQELISELVSITSLSVYRIKTESGSDTGDSNLKKISSPVDHRLDELTKRLTHYQFELTKKTQEVSSNLQKEVLSSLLYEVKKESKSIRSRSLSKFDSTNEKEHLITAYKQLGVYDNSIEKKINLHVQKIQNAVEFLKAEKLDDDNDKTEDSFLAIEAWRRTGNIVNKSLDAEEKIKYIYKKITQFTDVTSKFISDKSISFDGELIISNKDGKIPLSKLSSGEKQLLIILTEALLQKEAPYIFLTDEPELSLHIEWQREIIPAITLLNPNAQIIVATHSPEIAGKFQNNVQNMSKILYVRK